MSKFKTFKIARAGLRPSSDPNVIPFIDILLVLLIIFMVAAPRPTVDIQADLPQHGATVTPIQPTIISLRADGPGYSIFVDDERVALDDLEYRAAAHLQRNNPGVARKYIYAEGRLYVRADQSANYGAVVEVMDVLKTSGFAKVGIFAQQAEAS